MTKKRMATMVVCSPIILTVLALMVLASAVGYATTGKWELKELVNSWRRA